MNKKITPVEIDKGIERFNKLIQKVVFLIQNKIKYNDQQKTNAEFQIIETIREIFGDNSPEFEKYKYYKIWHGGYNTLDSDYERQKKFEKGISQTIVMLKGLIEWLEQKKHDVKSAINYWNFVNPIWLIWQLILKIIMLLKHGWKHKIISGIIILLTLLATDYAMAWRNLQWFVNFFRNIR